MSGGEHVLAGANTFGRDGAMFSDLLAFIAQLSVVLWGTVLVTLVIRFVLIRRYRRDDARRTSAEMAPTVGADRRQVGAVDSEPTAGATMRTPQGRFASTEDADVARAWGELVGARSGSRRPDPGRSTDGRARADRPGNRTPAHPDGGSPAEDIVYSGESRKTPAGTAPKTQRMRPARPAGAFTANSTEA